MKIGGSNSLKGVVCGSSGCRRYLGPFFAAGFVLDPRPASSQRHKDLGKREGKVGWTDFFQRQFQRLDYHRDSHMQQGIQKMQKWLLFHTSTLEIIPDILLDILTQQRCLERMCSSTVPVCYNCSSQVRG